MNDDLEDSNLELEKDVAELNKSLEHVDALFFAADALDSVALHANQYVANIDSIGQGFDSAHQNLDCGSFYNGAIAGAIISAYEHFARQTLLTLTQDEKLWTSAKAISAEEAKKNNSDKIKPIIPSKAFESRENFKEYAIRATLNNPSQMAALIRKYFQFDFPPVDFAQEIINKRNFFTHHGGRDLDGKAIKLNREDVERLFVNFDQYVGVFARSIKEHLEKAVSSIDG